jgi:hypothetical protein
MTGGRNRHAEDRFATAAREDASRHVPVFSALLHQRIVAEVRSTKRAPSGARPAVAASWIFAAAAAVLLAIVLVPVYMHRRVGPSQPGAFVQSSRSHSGSEEVALSAPSLNAALVTLGRGESAMEADLGPAHWAGLDHDARLAARYVLDPMSLPLTHKPRVR